MLRLGTTARSPRGSGRLIVRPGEASAKGRGNVFPPNHAISRRLSFLQHKIGSSSSAAHLSSSWGRWSLCHSSARCCNDSNIIISNKSATTAFPSSSYRTICRRRRGGGLQPEIRRLCFAIYSRGFYEINGSGFSAFQNIVTCLGDISNARIHHGRTCLP